MCKEVALVLSSGGPRGFAYIGAIEELESRGYRITSVAGTSIGSLIGGIYAAGRLPDFKDWLYSLNKWEIFRLMDLSLGLNHIIKGERIINEIRSVVPEIDIEDLHIPYCAIATDLYTGEEVVFRKGSLFAAIRASISIPSLFEPVKYGLSTLIDGAIANSLPINRIERKEGDILVAFDLNHINVSEIKEVLLQDAREEEEAERFKNEKKADFQRAVDFVTTRTEISLVKRLKLFGSRSIHLIKDVVKYRQENPQNDALEYGENLYELLDRTFNLANYHNTQLRLQLQQPDILVRMPFDAYGDIADYTKAKDIADIGRELMREALDRYESSRFRQC